MVTGILLVIFSLNISFKLKRNVLTTNLIILYIPIYFILVLFSCYILYDIDLNLLEYVNDYVKVHLDFS